MIRPGLPAGAPGGGHGLPPQRLSPRGPLGVGGGAGAPRRHPSESPYSPEGLPWACCLPWKHLVSIHSKLMWKHALPPGVTAPSTFSKQRRVSEIPRNPRGSTWTQSLCFKFDSVADSASFRC